MDNLPNSNLTNSPRSPVNANTRYEIPLRDRPIDDQQFKRTMLSAVQVPGTNPFNRNQHLYLWVFTLVGFCMLFIAFRTNGRQDSELVGEQRSLMRLEATTYDLINRQSATLGSAIKNQNDKITNLVGIAGANQHSITELNHRLNSSESQIRRLNGQFRTFQEQQERTNETLESRFNTMTRRRLSTGTVPETVTPPPADTKSTGSAHGVISPDPSIEKPAYAFLHHTENGTYDWFVPKTVDGRLEYEEVEPLENTRIGIRVRGVKDNQFYYLTPSGGWIRDTQRR